MTQVVPESKKPTDQVPQNIIEENFANSPSEGHEEGIPNNTAEVAVAKTIEEQTGAVDANDQEILEDPNIKVEPSADHTKIVVHKEVTNANVHVVTPESQADVVSKDAQNLGVSVVGETAETHTLGQTQGEFNPPEMPAHDPTDTAIFPSAFKTRELANPEKNGAPLQALWRKRLGELLHGIKPKILGGSRPAATQSPPENITQIPKPQEAQKAA